MNSKKIRKTNILCGFPAYLQLCLWVTILLWYFLKLILVYTASSDTIWATPRENMPSEHARSAKVLIRLRGRAVRSGLSLSAYRIIGHYRMYQWRANAPLRLRMRGMNLKGSISLKNRHFIVQEKLNKLIHGINTIIKCGTWQPLKFQCVSRSWNEMIFYCISELMLPTLIQIYDKKSFHFLFSSKTKD